MAISPVGFSAAPIPPVMRPTAPAGGADGFGAKIAQAVESLQNVQAKADVSAIGSATGDLSDVHEFMIASTEASLATQVTVAVRNKAIEAFNEIMRMQV